MPRQGCAACKLAGLRTIWAIGRAGSMENNTAVSVDYLKRHENSKKHKDAVAKIMGVRISSVAGAPSQDAFQKTLEAAQSNQTSGEVCGVGKRWKLRRMVFALAEAKRRADQQFLRHATSICLMQDVRKGKLLIRFRAANPKLCTRRGIIAQRKLHRSMAEDLRDATLKGLEDFCKRRKLPGEPPCDQIDYALLAHIMINIRFFTSDAAPDEQAAGNLLRRPPISDSWEKWLPNLRVVSRDRAHASRRITTRLPWVILLLVDFLKIIPVSDSSRIVWNVDVVVYLFPKHNPGWETSLVWSSVFCVPMYER